MHTSILVTEKVEQKLINGEIVILEKRRGETTEKITLTKEEFREIIGGQDNRLIMEDCFSLLGDSQIFSNGVFYRIVHGKKLVVDIFKEYANFFIDAINDNIEMFGLDGE